MPQTNKLDVKVYPVNEPRKPGEPRSPLEFSDVNYISFISSPGGQGEGTFGIPAIVSDERYKREGLPLRVLFVNPANVAAMDVTRTA